MAEKELTRLQVYNAMIKFLEIYYELTKSGDVGSLLSVMQFRIDGGTANPASWEDWVKCIDATLKEPENHKQLLTFISTDKKL